MSRSQPKHAWDNANLANPHLVPDKRERVRRMFAAIAPSYDLNNRLHSFCQDQRWRRKAVKLANLKSHDVVIDVACGTGDLTLKFAAANPQTTIGVDFTYEMLPIAKRKSQISNLRSPICYINADAQCLPLSDESAGVVSIAFGIRNVQDPTIALREFHRILRPGGRLIILEFSLPTNRFLRAVYNFYFRKVLPRTATWISRDKTGAYKYLPESVNTFMTRDRMMQMLRDAGFGDVEGFPLTLGVCVCYRGVKA